VYKFALTSFLIMSFNRVVVVHIDQKVVVFFSLQLRTSLFEILDIY
jgi:hypothetical protein